MHHSNTCSAIHAWPLPFVFIWWGSVCVHKAQVDLWKPWSTNHSSLIPSSSIPAKQPCTQLSASKLTHDLSPSLLINPGFAHSAESVQFVHVWWFLNSHKGASVLYALLCCSQAYPHTSLNLYAIWMAGECWVLSMQLLETYDTGILLPMDHLHGCWSG